MSHPDVTTLAALAEHLGCCPDCRRLVAMLMPVGYDDEVRRSHLMLVALAGLAAAGPAASAGEPACASVVEAWQVTGALAPARSCGGFVLTDGAGSHNAYGRAMWREPVTVPLRVRVTWRRLGPEKRPLEIILPGGVFVLFKQGAWGVYVDDAQFAVDGWQPLSGFDPRRESTVVVEQRAGEIVAWVDGRAAGRFPLATAARSGSVGLGFKGENGYRSRLLFRDFSVRSLAAPSQ